MAYQMQSFKDFYCRRCNDQNPKSLSMSWVTDDLICNKCKSEEKDLDEYSDCREVELLTLKPYPEWCDKINLVLVSSIDGLYTGEFNNRKFLFTVLDKQCGLYRFIKILK